MFENPHLKGASDKPVNFSPDWSRFTAGKPVRPGLTVTYQKIMSWYKFHQRDISSLSSRLILPHGKVSLLWKKKKKRQDKSHFKSSSPPPQSSHNHQSYERIDFTGLNSVAEGVMLLSWMGRCSMCRSLCHPCINTSCSNPVLQHHNQHHPEMILQVLLTCLLRFYNITWYSNSLTFVIIFFFVFGMTSCFILNWI